MTRFTHEESGYQYWVEDGELCVEPNGDYDAPTADDAHQAFTVWLSSLADRLRQERDAVRERLDYNLTYFPAQMVERDDRIAALEAELAELKRKGCAPDSLHGKGRQ